MPVSSRPAPRSTVPVNVLKSLTYTAVLWVVFLFAFPAAIWLLESAWGLTATRFAPGALRPVAVLVFVGGALVGFWSGWVLIRLGGGTPMPFECTHRLVIAGPYRHIRNPMAAMGIAQGVAVGLYLGSSITIVYALLGAAVWNYIARPWEERDMIRRFGNEFELYRRSVPCWLPRLVPYRTTTESE